MNSGSELALVKYYIVHTLFDNFVIKFLSGVALAMSTDIYGSHMPVINFIILAFLIDFILGLAVAFDTKSFASWKFFKGAMKLGVYGILVLIGYGLDMVAHTGETFMTFMFAFIILRDTSSMLEKLHLLGYNVPFFLIKYLDVAQKRFDSQIIRILENTEMVPVKKVEDLDLSKKKVD